MSLDDSAYPSEEELERVASWNPGDAQGWLSYVMRIWRHSGRAWIEGDIYHFSTGGWSGNEEIIAAMQKNVTAWAMNWYSSTRGGRYEFCPSRVS